MSDLGLHSDGDLGPAEAVLFANDEWRVLTDGLEHRATGYFIARGAVAARLGDGLWQWPLHLAEKSWCTPRLFREAFGVAVERFGHARDEALTRSFAIGFGTRPGAGGARDGFVALGELVRPRPAARKWPEAMTPARRVRAGAKAARKAATTGRLPADASA